MFSRLRKSQQQVSFILFYLHIVTVVSGKVQPALGATTLLFIRISGCKLSLLLMCVAWRSNQSLNAGGGKRILEQFLTIVSWIPVASVKAQRRLTVWPGYDNTSGSTFTR